MNKFSDQEIIDSVLKGNESDYSIIIDRYKNKAFSLLKRMLKNDFDAEEVLQDSFLKAYNSLRNFKGEAKFSTWFYKIVYNTALTKLSSKKRKIESEMSSVEDHYNLESDLDSVHIEKKDLSEFLQSIVNKLPERYAAIISMFYLNDMSIEEISEVMQISVSNVKVMLYRSRISLRDLILKNKLAGEII
ncbi:MAG: RNA polymerase sigma factor [Ignavibacteriaceae bacterium]|nr:RNA polymerase sigma factor [Ignavibacteria bacterium]NNJ51871.1 RNA polymerase sigma factor [Ignavibacteriaceae bacterium]